MLIVTTAKITELQKGEDTKNSVKTALFTEFSLSFQE
ncbi:hypothetical protein EVA_07462 [gut metagenome]|uniref:Uncharacterized protein n=1 Tax=gut metagenome TaxID=749906 RepID=J9GV76_9ZZZZ